MRIRSLQNRLQPVYQVIGQIESQWHYPNALVSNGSAFHGIFFRNQNAPRLNAAKELWCVASVIWQCKPLTFNSLFL